jgi:hypothetical protein
MQLPAEIIRLIHQWTFEFHRRDAMDRVAAFAATFGLEPADASGEQREGGLWGMVMSDVRDNVPRYSVTLNTESGFVLHLSVFTPDCNPAIWDGRALGSSFLKFRRRALACGRR